MPSDVSPDKDRLNCLISEHVFGVKPTVNTTRRGNIFYTLGPADYYDDQGSLVLFNPLPNYSGNIAAAWEALEKSGVCGINIYQSNISKLWICHDQDTEESVSSSEASESICKIILKLKGVL